MTKDYVLSFWAKDSYGSINITGGATLSKTGPTIGGGWIYYEYKIPMGSSSPVITGATGFIDEVRLFPTNSLMTTTAYDPIKGKIADCDANNRITFYEYDGLGRLVKIKDENYNILKTFEYHYKNN
jgi:YD repeat-containing protein